MKKYTSLVFLLILLLSLNIIPLSLIVNATGNTFGYTSEGGSAVSIANSIQGSEFTPTSNGGAQYIRAFLSLRPREFGITESYSQSSHSTAGIIRGGMFMTLPYAMVAQSIDAKILCTVATNFKAAIYTSDGTLIAQSSEQTIPADSTLIWRNFVLTSPVMLAASTNYILAVWSESSSGTNALGVWSIAGGNGRFFVESYGDGTFPSSVTFLTNDIQYNIHCNCNIPVNVKTAIYLASDHSFIAGSEPVLVMENGWATFNFASPQPMLTASTTYLLVAWADNTADLAFTVGDYSTQGYTSDQTYGSWPSTLAGTVQNRKYSIYCFYEEPVPITFQTNGIGTLPGTETVLTIDGTDYAYSQFSQQIALDGQTSGTSGGTNTISLVLSTTNTDDLLYVVVSLQPSYSVSSITSSGLSWNFRAATQYGLVRAETWYAVPSLSTSNEITITLSDSHLAAAVAFGISGVDTDSPFDGSATTSSGHGHFAGSSITTANENDFIIGALSVFDSPQNGLDWASGGGFTNILTQHVSYQRTASAEYRIVSSTGTYTPSYSWNDDGDHDQDYAMIADALKQKPQGTESITFNWIPGSEHTVAAATPLSNGKTPGSWTNGDGLSGASGMYTTPGSAATVTVNYWADDTTKPVSAVSSLSSYEASLTFDVPYSASDAGGSGVQYVELYYSKDGGAWTKFGTTFTVSPISFTASADGVYGFYTRATDNAGYIEDALGVADASTTVDTANPVSEVSSLPTYENSLTFNVPYSASDTGGSGVQYVELYYRVGGSGGYSNFGTTFASSPISFTASGDGFYEFYTIATDNAGNTEDAPGSADASTNVETTKPESSVNTLSTSQSSLKFSIPYSAFDTGGSGVHYAELYYRKDGGVWTKFGTTFASSPISFKTNANGFYEFYTRATDNAGNVEDAPGVADASTTVAAAPVSVIFEASGLDALPSTETVLTIDGTPYTWSQFAPPLALDGSASGSVTSVNTFSFTLTTTKTNDLLYVVVAESNFDHVTSITSPGLTWHFRKMAQNGIDLKLETWYAVPSTSTSNTITITTYLSNDAAAVAFGISGVDTDSPFDVDPTATYGYFDYSGLHSSSITTTYAHDFIIGALGISNFPETYPGSGYDIILTETAGIYRRATAEYKIVSEAGTYTPTYQFSSTGWALIADAVKRAPGGTGGITFNWLTGSEHTVIASTYLSDGSAFDDWTNGDGLSGASGTYTTPGLATTVIVNYVSDETTKPVSAVGSLSTYQTLTFNVPYSASDAGSGVQYVELYYRVGGSGAYTKFGTTFTSSPISFTASADGFYEFYTRATDNAGNVEDAPESADASTTVDTTKPVSAVGSLPTEENSLTFDVPYSASDAGSGVQYVELYYRVGGSGAYTKFGTTFTSSPISFTASADGFYEFYTRATDNAGYVEDAPGTADASTTVFTVDAEASYSPIGDSYTAFPYPDTNYGTTSQLSAGVYPAGSWYIYIKFDLSSVPDSATITSATLHLYKSSGMSTPPNAYTTSDFYSGTSTPWTETGITWNNAPSLGSFLSSGSSEAGNWFGWDVTSYATSEVAGDNILSLLLKYPIETSPGTGAVYASKEVPPPNTSLAPWLDVSYTPSHGYTLTVDTNPASIDSTTGSGTHNSGDIVTITAPEYQTIDSSSRYYFDHWSSDAGSFDDASSASTDFTMPAGAVTVTANYVTQYYLTVGTSPAGVDSPTGEGWYDSGVTAHVSADQYVDIVAGSSRYRFDSWTGASGDYSDATIVMDAAKTATANYVTQYYLTVENGGHGTAGGSGYYDNGVTAYATITPLTVSGDPGVQFEFAGWTGDASGSGSPSDGITMDGAKTATATWTTLDTAKPVSAVGSLSTYQTLTFDVSYSASDANSGVQYVELYYRVGGSGGYTKFGTTFTSSPISFTASADGFYEFYTIATDNADNVEDAPGVADASTTVDTTAPTGSVIIDSGATYAVSTSVTLTLSASDTNGVVQMQFSDDGSSWSGWEAYGTSKSYTLPAGDGTKTVYVMFKDNAGFESTSYSDSIILDTTTPSTTDDYDGLWHTSDFTITLAPSDATSGVTETYYKINGGATMALSSDGQPQITIESATNSLEYWSVDNAGNEEMPHIIVNNIKLDKIDPTLTKDLSGTEGSNGWYISNVEVTLTGGDSGSGLASVEYNLNSGGWTTYTGPFTISVEGENTLEHRATDNAGNSYTLTVQTIKIDNSDPTLTKDLSGTAGSNVWYISTVEVTLTPGDASPGSGFALTEYKLNAGDWTDYTGPFTISSEGENTLAHRVTDFAGRQYVLETQTIKIDLTDPTLTKDLSGTEGSNGWYISNVEVTLTGGDSGSGLASVEYNLNSGGWTTYTGPFTISVEGENTLEHRATDNAGNSYTLTVQTIKIDNSDPEIYITSPGNGAYFNVGTVPVVGTASDGATVFKVEVKIDSGSYSDATDTSSVGDWSTWEFTTGSLSVGSHIITARVTDMGGSTATDSITVIVGATSLTNNGVFSGQYSDEVTVTATLIDLATGLGIPSQQISFTIASLPTVYGTTDADGIAEATITLNQASGITTIISQFAGNSDYVSSMDSDTFTVNKESAIVEYTGDTFVTTAAKYVDGDEIPTVTVRLAAIVTQVPDLRDGDLSLAKVQFTIEGDDIESTHHSWTVSGIPVNFAGQAAAFLEEVPVGSYSIEVRIDSNNPYWIGEPDVDDVLLVEPSGGEGYVTGGGWIPSDDSINGKINFGFVVHFDKRGNPKGSFVAVFKSIDGFTYRIKSTSWAKASLTFGENSESDPIAYFIVTGVVQKINRSTGEVVDSWGNCKIMVDMTDSDYGENPNGHIDSIAITVVDNTNTILFQWGTKASQINIGNGNIVVASTKTKSAGPTGKKK